jgi:hypothetical protein
MKLLINHNVDIKFHTINETIILFYKKQRVDLHLIHTVNRLLILGKR